MSDENLNDEMLKLVTYEIVCIERDHEKVLLCNACKIFSDSMDACDFDTWVIAEYVADLKREGKTLPCNRKDLRVAYRVQDRWAQEDRGYEGRRLRRLAAIAQAIRQLRGGRLPPTSGEDVEKVGDSTEAEEVEKIAESAKVEAVEKTPETAKAAAVLESAEAAESDDLTKIEGVGPKIAELLAKAGIVTFSQLARRTVRRLQGILDAAGPRYRLADPATWRDQARLAAAGNWPALAQLQEELKGGRLAKEKATKDAEPEASQLDEGETQVLEALAALGGQAAMRALVAETGLSSSTLSRRLKTLIAAGLVRRKGDGLKTRYQRVAK